MLEESLAPHSLPQPPFPSDCCGAGEVGWKRECSFLTGQGMGVGLVPKLTLSPVGFRGALGLQAPPGPRLQ